MKYEKPSFSSGTYHGAKTAAACLEPRNALSNIGGVVKPPGAPPPSSKGAISHPKQVGK